MAAMTGASAAAVVNGIAALAEEVCAIALVGAYTGINKDQWGTRVSRMGSDTSDKNYTAVIDGDPPTIVHRGPLDGGHALGDSSWRPRFSASKMCSTAKMFMSERMFSPIVRFNGKYVRGGGGHDNHSKTLKELGDIDAVIDRDTVPAATAPATTTDDLSAGML
jgi:hypothetical protein